MHLMAHQTGCHETNERRTSPGILALGFGKVGAPLRILVVGRSSDGPPKAFRGTTEFFNSNVKRHYTGIVEAYRSLRGISGETAAAAVHYACYCQTRHLPASDIIHVRDHNYRAHVFTRSIMTDLQRSEDPIMVTVGADGFACNLSRIAAWLRTMRPFSMGILLRKKGKSTRSTAKRQYGRARGLLARVLVDRAPPTSRAYPVKRPIKQRRSRRGCT